VKYFLFHLEPVPTIATSNELRHRPILRLPRIHREIQKLKDVAKHLFIIDTDPISNPNESDDKASSSPKYIIIMEGRILPISEPYSQRSFRIRFSFEFDYPFKPPVLKCLDKMYHPNIDDQGRICLAVLDEYDGYNPSKSLTDIIRAVDELFSHPNINYAINLEANAQYQKGLDGFNRKALDYVLRYGHPRT
jgi:ubiquitin-protein ligase